MTVIIVLPSIGNICRPIGNIYTTAVRMNVTEKKVILRNYLQGCIQKFPDWFDNEIYAYNNKLSLRSNKKGYGGNAH
jgi:hypothetical protein